MAEANKAKGLTDCGRRKIAEELPKEKWVKYHDPGLPEGHADRIHVAKNTGQVQQYEEQGLKRLEE